eukprot:m.86321 g.86321  ORF g.86321 m.86321 type:complete len:316 (-) comp12800_c0_seq1:411-1358(-)
MSVLSCCVVSLIVFVHSFTGHKEGKMATKACKKVTLQFIWMALALLTIIASGFYVRLLFDFNSDLNGFLEGNTLARRCLLDQHKLLYDSASCPDGDAGCKMFLRDPTADETQFPIDQRTPTNSFPASIYHSCGDVAFCQDLFTQSDSSNFNPSDWKQATTIFKTIPTVTFVIASLCLRALSGALSTFLQMISMCRTHIKKGWTMWLYRLKNLTGFGSALMFFVCGIALYTYDKKNVLQQTIDARCFDFTGLSTLSGYTGLLDSLRTDQFASAGITIVSLIGEILTTDDGADEGADDERHDSYALGSQLLTNEGDL